MPPPAAAGGTSPKLPRAPIQDKATTTEIRTSHVPFISRPDVVANVIRDAAESP